MGPCKLRRSRKTRSQDRMQSSPLSERQFRKGLRVCPSGTTLALKKRIILNYLEFGPSGILTEISVLEAVSDSDLKMSAAYYR